MNYLYENRILPKELECQIVENNSLHQFFEQSFNGIKTKNYCGFLELNSNSYFILPKITDSKEQNLEIFINMLIYAYNIKIDVDSFISSKDKSFKFIELFIEYFTNMLLKELKQGVYKEYITKQENLRVLKGNYIPSKNFSNFYNQNIFCEFDEFSPNNKLNQFFFYAIKLFKKVSKNKKLMQTEAIFDEVEYKNIDINRIKIDWNRLNSRFSKSFDIAMLILKKLIALPSKGSNRNFAFLFDMAEVFEEFVGKIYKSIDKTTVLQKQRNFGSLVLKPDIITNSCIIDTKYKKLSKRDELSTQDKYQMFVYGIKFKTTKHNAFIPKTFSRYK